MKRGSLWNVSEAAAEVKEPRSEREGGAWGKGCREGASGEQSSMGPSGEPDLGGPQDVGGKAFGFGRWQPGQHSRPLFDGKGFFGIGVGFHYWVGVWQL